MDKHIRIHASGKLLFYKINGINILDDKHKVQ